MSLSNSTSKVQYRGDGSQVEFPVPFYFLDDSHLNVVLYDSETDTETVKTITTHYAVAGEGEVVGGSITMVTAPASHELLTILRDVPITQELNYRENSLFPANMTEQALDKITMILQQLDELIRRGILLKVTHSGGEVDFPAGGYTAVFPAKITATVSLVARTFTVVEQEPLAAGGWQNKSGGITATAVELVSGNNTDWPDEIPLYVNVYVHTDEDGDLTYVFQTPQPCIE